MSAQGIVMKQVAVLGRWSGLRTSMGWQMAGSDTATRTGSGGRAQGRRRVPIVVVFFHNTISQPEAWSGDSSC